MPKGRMWGKSMKHGFVKVAAVTPKIVVADTAYNADIICDCIAEASAAGAKIIVLPELCITGYTCGDLFLQEKMLREAKNALLKIAGRLHCRPHLSLTLSGVSSRSDSGFASSTGISQKGPWGCSSCILSGGVILFFPHHRRSSLWDLDSSSVCHLSTVKLLFFSV